MNMFIHIHIHIYIYTYIHINIYAYICNEAAPLWVGLTSYFQVDDREGLAVQTAVGERNIFFEGHNPARTSSHVTGLWRRPFPATLDLYRRVSDSNDLWHISTPNLKPKDTQPNLKPKHLNRNLTRNPDT